PTLEEEPRVEEAQRLRSVERERALLLQRLGDRRLRAPVHVALAREQILRSDPRGREPPVLELDAGRRHGREAASLPVVDRVQVPVVEQAAAAALDRLAREGLVQLEVELVRRPDLVLLVEDVNTAARYQAQRLRLRFV